MSTAASRKRERDKKWARISCVLTPPGKTIDPTLYAHDRICEICGDPEDGKHHAVDHNHKTGAIRGILCMSCNTGLGKFKDNPDLLRKAAAYIEMKP